MLTAALFTTGNTWKTPKCPSANEWIKKMWYTYTMEYYTAIGKNEIMPFKATWADLEMIVLSEASQQEKDKYHMIITYMWNSKYDTNEPMERNHRYREYTGRCQGRGDWWRDEGRG